MSTLVIADDHQLLRQALRRALEDHGHDVLAEAADGEDAVRAVLEHLPDVVVMDVTMPILDGIEATRRVIQARPESRILVLTMHGEPAVVSEALAAGATAFLTKDSSMQDVVRTVEDLAAGQILLSPELASRMLDEFQEEATPASAAGASKPPAPASPLTKREEELLQLIANGASTTGAAESLFISVKTVKNHLASIYDKLDARDRTQAVVTGVRLGIIVLR